VSHSSAMEGHARTTLRLPEVIRAYSPMMASVTSQTTVTMGPIAPTVGHVMAAEVVDNVWTI
jgi:hypothetical protein